ncbi:hypothetical protein [Piscinibacter gummiphilus]|uniref:Uncharacterized protein n=1 Tax=Piscinibacter gummiphilus TaxID=946333 RepID=A0ABZ0CPF6_9BURK|nr:hypothetical protein [Piscinibacter gummiphilus]WOB06865.1 hypothetical protein RXV79_18305 [Piscinibacter gummiphilus]
MLTPAEANSLLATLCVKLGFCLPPEEQSRLSQSPPGTVDAFTDAVFQAEGMNPVIEVQLRRQVRALVAEAFE